MSRRNLWKEAFIMAYSSRGRSIHHGGETCNTWQARRQKWELRPHSFKCNQEAERERDKIRIGVWIYNFKTHPSDTQLSSRKQVLIYLNLWRVFVIQNTQDGIYNCVNIGPAIEQSHCLLCYKY